MSELKVGADYHLRYTSGWTIGRYDGVGFESLGESRQHPKDELEEVGFRIPEPDGQQLLVSRSTLASILDDEEVISYIRGSEAKGSDSQRLLADVNELREVAGMKPIDD